MYQKFSSIQLDLAFCPQESASASIYINIHAYWKYFQAISKINGFHPFLFLRSVNWLVWRTLVCLWPYRQMTNCFWETAQLGSMHLSILHLHKNARKNRCISKTKMSEKSISEQLRKGVNGKFPKCLKTNSSFVYNIYLIVFNCTYGIENCFK